jgi:hypothetical protein
MPHLSPQTLTEAEQRRLRRATADHPRDHLLFSLALGTGLRLARGCQGLQRCDASRLKAESKERDAGDGPSMPSSASEREAADTGPLERLVRRPDAAGE